MNRGCKFSLFKPAEEMVYITLDQARGNPRMSWAPAGSDTSPALFLPQESRTKGKAAIDVVGAQTGKSSSSILQQVLLLLSGGNLTLVLPVMMAFQVSILRSWLHAVFVLSKYYEKTQKRAARLERKRLLAEEQQQLLLLQAGPLDSVIDPLSSMDRDLDEMPGIAGAFLHRNKGPGDDQQGSKGKEGGSLP